MTRLLNAEHLTASYRTPDGREVTAVDDVSIYIDEGEVLGVAGESGCGKTTLGSIISLTARPPLYVDSGTLEIDGKVQDLGGNRKVERIWRGSVVSFLPQGAMNAVSPTMRIRDLVYDVVRAHDRSIKKDEALDRARDRLTSLGLPARVIDAYPHQLSGGMKQRTVTIISTLLNPRLLIADEPTSALDVSSQKALCEMLLEMLEKHIMRGVIFVTHDLPVLREVPTRIAVMYAGKIARDRRGARAHRAAAASLLRGTAGLRPLAGAAVSQASSGRNPRLTTQPRESSGRLPIPPAMRPLLSGVPHRGTTARGRRAAIRQVLLGSEASRRGRTAEEGHVRRHQRRRSHRRRLRARRERARGCHDNH